VFAAAVVSLAVWRATLGISFVDDASYVVIPLRFAQGARPLADEMTVQGLGFLIVVPFVKVWTLLFGTSGLVLATRLFYVALATVAGVGVRRLLRPTLGDWPAAIAVAAVVLAPPYNVMAVSYNTTAEIAFILAAAFAWVAVRDGARRLAAAAGVAAAVGVVSYPSLAPVAATLALALLAVAWRRRLVVPLALAGLGTLAACGGLILVVAMPHGVSQAVHYSVATWSTNAPFHARLSKLVEHVHSTLTDRWLLPAWILAVVSCVPPLPARTRAGLLALVPIAAAAFPAWHHLGHRAPYFGEFGTASLATVTAVLGLPVVWRVVREYRREPGSRDWCLLALTGPPALLGFVIVAVSTSSGWYRGLGFVGLAPLVIVVLAYWGRFVREQGGRGWLGVGATGLIAVVLIALFSSSFQDGRPLTLSIHIWHGPLAGITTSDGQAARIAAVEALGRRWVGPRDRVLVFSAPLVYLLVGGRIDTNAVWLDQGASDARTVQYYVGGHAAPDVVLVSDSIVARNGGRALTGAHDPLVRFLHRYYQVAETGPMFEVLVHRSG
jgi:4-amino-4-deoxy-L-arabinose transferase-like glycosyltransferase